MINSSSQNLWDTEDRDDNKPERKLKGIVKWIYLGASFAAIFLTIAFIFYPGFLFSVVKIDAAYYSYLFAVLMPFVFILHPATKKEAQGSIPWYDFLLALLAFCGFVWIGFNIKDARFYGWVIMAPLDAAIIGTILWLLSLEAGRRCGGTPFVIVTFFFSIIPLFGHILPLPFTTPHQPIERIPMAYFIGNYGVWGPAIRALARYIIGFLIFGSVLQFTGGGNYFIKIALSLVGRYRGATAKVCVVGSGLFGMLSGSSISNVVTTGTVTIPAMKRSGYTPKYAGAIEAVASTGGLIMPPVMGSVAFIMAELTSTPYVNIALAAFLPGFLYFLAVFLQSDMWAAKNGMVPVPKEDRPKLTLFLFLEGWNFIIAAVVLVYLIFVPQIITRAPYIATIVLLIGGIAKKNITIKNVTNLITTIINMLVMFVALFACLGLVTGSLWFTGLGLSVSSIMMRLGQENIILLCFIAGFLCMILGMGITPSAVYILAAVLFAPALVRLGLDLMSVHLFILYYSCVATFTPPVGITSLAASRLAGADYMETGFQAMRLGIVMYVVPFYFVDKPELILQGTLWNTLISLAIVTFCLIIISAGFERYMYGIGRITTLEAYAAIVGGFFIILPTKSLFTVIGWILSGILVVLWIIKFKLKTTSTA